MEKDQNSKAKNGSSKPVSDQQSIEVHPNQDLVKSTTVNLERLISTNVYLDLCYQKRGNQVLGLLPNEIWSFD